MNTKLLMVSAFILLKALSVSFASTNIFHQTRQDIVTEMNSTEGHHPMAELGEPDLRRWYLAKEERLALEGNFKDLVRRKLKLSYTEHKDFISSIEPADISEQNLKVLKYFLACKHYCPNEREKVQLFALKNDVLDLLVKKRSELSDDLGMLMIDIVKDHQHDPLWREYVLQYFVFYYQSRWPENENNDAGNIALRNTFQKVLACALSESGCGLAGTSIIVLNQLEKTHPEFAFNYWKDAVLQLCENEDANLATRITAVQMVGKTGDPNTFQALSNFIYDDKCCKVMKIAAVGALSEAASLNQNHQAVCSILSGCVDNEALDPLTRAAADRAHQRVIDTNHN